MQLRPCLLLDVDGVLIRNDRILNSIVKRAELFVSKYAPPNVDIVKFNRSLREIHSHTVFGLQNECKLTDITIDEFNEFVYTPEILDSLWSYLKGDDFSYTKENLNRIDSPTYLFSNAPLVWTSPVAEILNIDPQNILVPKSGLKPYRSVYDEVYIKVAETVENPYLVFLDDSVVNLVPLNGSTIWKPIYYSERECCSIKGIDTINDICQLQWYLY